MGTDLLSRLLDVGPPLVAVASLTANLLQFGYGRSRRSTIDKQAAIRTPLTGVLTALEPVAIRPAGADWPGVFARTETLAVALRQLDTALVGARGAPLAVVLTVTRLILATEAVLRWRAAFSVLCAGRSYLPERDYLRWADRRAAEADLRDLRRALNGGQDPLRSYMALLNA